MKTSLKTTANKSAPGHVPSDSHLIMALQYLMSVVLALALAGLGVWLQHALGNHSQALSAQELTAQPRAAPPKFHDERNEVLPIPDSFDIEPMQLQSGERS